MLTTRVIPSLLLRDGGLVKGQSFARHRYVGDPINTVRIFNEKEVDEIVFLDISATAKGSGPNYELLEDIASQAFMPFGYGGGIKEVAQVERLIRIGVEKVIINSAAAKDSAIVRAASEIAGSQSVVASIDVRRKLFGRYRVQTRSGTLDTGIDPVDYARRMEDAGAGEILLCSIDREGSGRGYDLELVKMVAEAVSVPVVASGGAAGIDDFERAIEHGASAVSAGDLFTFYGRHKAVLITYPLPEELERLRRT